MMSDDLISRSELISKYLLERFDTEADMNRVEILINNAPTVERPKGEWKHNGFCVTTTQYKCSKCGMHSLDRSKFCPNCGADMRGDNNAK